ncbi:hypothetical protein EC973_006322 [Apophysomyces ossiformis]|uniref:Uncharacterized protein n=1 Tax=Apophysomyces ossiformis TaxID=679940 RepID=A0A8H7BGP1_9FUNG|nr:hypothetical protein EC973_006322 [Apophysomyces ossiformis]
MNRFLEKANASDYLRHIAPKFQEAPEQLDLLIKLAANSMHQQRSLVSPDYDPIQFIRSSTLIVNNIKGCEPLPANVFPVEPESSSTISDAHYGCLLDFYANAYADEHVLYDFRHCPPNGTFVNNWIEKYHKIELLGQKYRSAEAESQRGSHIQALFLERGGGDEPRTVAWPGQVLYFFTPHLS